MQNLLYDIDITCAQVPAHNIVDPRDPFVREPDIRTREPCKVEASIQNSECLRTELAKHVSVLYYERVHSLLEPHSQIRVSYEVYRLKDRVCLSVIESEPGIALVDRRRRDYLSSEIPCRLKILRCSSSDLIRVELHYAVIVAITVKRFVCV